jgi:hypothetical protein
MYMGAAATHIHAFGTTDYLTGYGFAGNNGAGSLAVSNEYKGFSIHKNSLGSKIRSGSASGLAWLPALGANSTTFTQPTGANIVFDKGYDAPPLIFITESSGPIALNFITRDSFGKYVGAQIVPAATLLNSGDARGVAAFTNNSCTFSYFIVSSEPAQYSDVNDFGMKVFNASSECIFDSSAFIPSIHSWTIAKPYFCLDSDMFYRNHAAYTLTFSSLYTGVCINNFPAFAGTTSYASWAISGVYGGPINFCGRYLSKSGITAQMYGAPTLAFLKSPCYPGTQPASWDFTRGGDQNMPILYANYMI